MSSVNRIGAESIRARDSVKMAVFGALGVNALGLLALLIQGCRQEPTAAKEELANRNPPASSVVTNLASAAATNVIVLRSNVPAAEVASTNAQASLASTNFTYTIVGGDTLCGLARTSHTTVQALLEANPGIEPTRLQVGQKIRLPETSRTIARAMEAQAEAGDASAECFYTVRPGDYLLKLAAQFRTTAGAIREANGLRTDRIEAGQRLKIPRSNAGVQPLAPREASLPNWQNPICEDWRCEKS